MDEQAGQGASRRPGGLPHCLKSVQNLELVENVIEIEFKEVY